MEIEKRTRNMLFSDPAAAASQHPRQFVLSILHLQTKNRLNIATTKINPCGLISEEKKFELLLSKKAPTHLSLSLSVPFHTSLISHHTIILLICRGMMADDVDDTSGRVQWTVQHQCYGTVVRVGGRIPGGSSLLENKLTTVVSDLSPYYLITLPSPRALAISDKAHAKGTPVTVSRWKRPSVTESVNTDKKVLHPPTDNTLCDEQIRFCLPYLFISVNIRILARHFRDRSRLGATTTAKHRTGDGFPLQWGMRG